MCFYQDFYADCFQKEVRKAKKEHRCDGGCKVPIRPGELYEYQSGIFDGSPFSTKICGVCDHTLFRIHQQEIEHGCSWHESWCPLEELNEYLKDSEMKRSSRSEGLAFMLEERQKQDKRTLSIERIRNNSRRYEP